MIYLEHVNLVVSDMPAMLKFYQIAFPHWKIRDEGDSEWYGKPRKWLHFGDEYQYLALSDNGEDENRNLESQQIGLAHFAYVVESIDAIIERLDNSGFQIAKEGNDHPYRKNVYFIDPAGFEVEFVEYLGDLPAQRNSTIE